MNIAFATDKNYLYQTMVTIESIMQSKKIATSIDIYLLADGLSDKDISDCKIFFEDKYRNFTIQFLDTTDSISDALQVQHISPTTCCRLLLPRLLNQLDRCLYLDSDIIVKRDLCDLYDTDMGGNLVCAIKGYGYHVMPEEKKKEYSQKIDIEGLDQYVNAGVLLMNLKDLRECNFAERALSLVPCHYPAQDQDIINQLCYNRIGFLAPKYNLMTNWVNNGLLEDKTVYGEEEAKYAGENPCIIHYCHSIKPWDFPDSVMADEWWRICEQTVWFEYFFERIKRVFYYSVINNHDELWKTKTDIQEWIELLKSQNNVYVYGIGTVGKQKVDFLLRHEVNIKKILVSSGNETMSHYEGISIQEYPCDLEKDAVILLAVGKRYFKEIRDVLYKQGVTRIIYYS